VPWLVHGVLSQISSKKRLGAIILSFFFSQFCEVAITHKKDFPKFGYKHNMKQQKIEYPSIFLATTRT
jgi:hypothetical protein